MGAGSSLGFKTDLDSKTRTKRALQWQKDFVKVTAPNENPCPSKVKHFIAAWESIKATLAQQGGYIPFADASTWRQVLTAFCATTADIQVPFDRKAVERFVFAACHHLAWCEGKSRTETEKILQHASAVAPIVRRIAANKTFWSGNELFYFELKKFCLRYMERFADWLEHDVYGGDAMSQERLLGLAHNQFNLPFGGTSAVRHTDVLPPVPRDKRTNKPFQNDYRFIVPLKMLGLCVQPVLERALQNFCALHKCKYRLRRPLRMDELVRTLLTDYFEEESPRAASNTQVVKAVIHADTGDIKNLMAKAHTHFGRFLEIKNEFETATPMDDKFGLRAIKACVAFSPQHPQHALGDRFSWGDILKSKESQQILSDFVAQHSSHPYHDKTKLISDMDRQVQIWTPLAKDWMQSAVFTDSPMEFLIRLDFMPTTYVHAHDQAVFPLALTCTNNINDMTEQLASNGDLF